MFTQQLTVVTYQGPTTSTGPGVHGTSSASEEGPDKPKGAFIVTSAPIPAQVRAAESVALLLVMCVCCVCE